MLFIYGWGAPIFSAMSFAFRAYPPRLDSQARACLYRKSDSAIMVMKSGEDGRRYDAAHGLDGAMDWSVLVLLRVDKVID